MIRKIFTYFVSEGYSQLALRGLAWSTIQQAAARVITFARIAILARILTPGQFGVFGIATLLISLIEILTDTGINVFLIQQNEHIKKYINTAWVISMVRGVVIATCIFLSASFVARFFNSSNAILVLQLAAIIPLIRGFINPAVITFQKDLKFDKEFYFRFTLFFIESMVSIGVAVATKSEISLIIGLIISAFIEVILSFALFPLRPHLEYNKKLIILIIQRGKWITSAGVINYLFENSDDIVVGKLLGAGSLGFYQMGYKIAILPITEISDVIAKVALPVFVKIGGDKKRLKNAYNKTFLLIGICSILFGLITFLFTKEIVLILLGEKWISIVLFLKVLIIFGVMRAVTGSVSVLFLATKKQEYISHFTSVSYVILMVLIIPFVNSWGLLGASIAALIACVLPIPLIIYYRNKLI